MRRQLIKTAINERRHLEFRYKGRLRVVVPMILGRCARGIWRLRAIQVGGASASGRMGPDAPKLFDVAGMTGVMLRDTTFGVPRGYERGEERLIVSREAEL